MTANALWQRCCRTLVLCVTLACLGHAPVWAARPSPDGEPSVDLPCDAPSDLAATRWIQVSLRTHHVRLCQGNHVLDEFLAATGIGTSPETTTFPGRFAVYEMARSPFRLPEYGVYVAHWVGFDEEHHNGFHSLPMDEYGHVLDNRLGEAVSHGCVRTAQSARIFEFAEIGMSVVVER